MRVLIETDDIQDAEMRVNIETIAELQVSDREAKRRETARRLRAASGDRSGFVSPAPSTEDVLGVIGRGGTMRGVAPSGPAKRRSKIGGEVVRADDDAERELSDEERALRARAEKTKAPSAANGGLITRARRAENIF